jgi:flagellar basal-body rod protein FlgF
MSAPDALTAAAAGMRAQADKLDVIAENLANVSTVAFRPREAAVTSFGDELNTRISSTSAQGTLRRTGVPTDIALSGPGYIALATPDGVRYTRDGRMSVDPQGYLADARGNRVLGSLGPVRFPHGAHIQEDGKVVVAGMPVDRLRVVAFDVPCTAGADGMFDAPHSRLPSRSTAHVHAGYLEESGVDAISQMSALIAVQRAYEANQQSATRTDESLRRVVTELPTVRS